MTPDAILRAAADIARAHHDDALASRILELRFADGRAEVMRLRFEDPKEQS